MNDQLKKDKHAAWKRGWRRANQDKVKATDRARYKANPEKSKARNKNWQDRNPGRIAQLAKEWRKENPERARELAAAWRENNREAYNAQKKVWRDNNPDKLAARQAKNRAQKLQATTWPEYDWIIQAFYTMAKQLTELTGMPHEVDHIIPLKGKYVCGLHVPANLNVVTKKANRKKRNLFANDNFEYALAA
jgi:hypothetical protein